MGATLYLVAKGGTPKAAANKGANDAIALMRIAAWSMALISFSPKIVPKDWRLRCHWRRSLPCARFGLHDAGARGMRWVAAITYRRTADGPFTVKHNIEDLIELRYLVERGPDMGTIIEIQITPRQST
jgi:hypothetical protein